MGYSTVLKGAPLGNQNASKHRGLPESAKLVEAKDIPLFRASDSDTLAQATGGHTALGTGTYFGTAEADVAGYGGKVRQYQTEGKLLEVAGDKEYDTYRALAAAEAQTRLREHYTSGKIDADFIAKLAHPSGAITEFLSRRGIAGVKYNQSSKDDHHSQVLIFDHKQVMKKAAQLIALAGSKSDRFQTILKANPYHDEAGRFSDHAGAKFVSLWGKKNIVAATSGGSTSGNTKPKANNVGLLKPAVDTRTYVEDAHTYPEFREHHEKQITKLTKPQRTAVYQYTGSAYGPMNSKLRGQPSYGDYDTGTLIKNMDAALEKSTVGKDVVVGRRLSLHKELQHLLDTHPEKLVGTVYTDKGFMSTTSSSFGVTGSTIALAISVKKEAKGLYVDSISQFKGEQELILPRDSKFLVTKVEETESYGGKKSRKLHLTLL